MKVFVMLFLATLFVVGCTGGGSDGKSVTTTAKVSEDGSEVVTSSQ